MKKHVSVIRAVLAAVVGVLLLLAPLPSALAASGTVSDTAFNEMVLDMASQDSGSQWFDAYVERINHRIAAWDTEQPYGAAGPSGPVSGFDAYLSGFAAPDTGEVWFGIYLDNLRRTMKAKAED